VRRQLPLVALPLALLVLPLSTAAQAPDAGLPPPAPDPEPPKPPPVPPTDTAPEDPAPAPADDPPAPEPPGEPAAPAPPPAEPAPPADTAPAEPAPPADAAPAEPAPAAEAAPAPAPGAPPAETTAAPPPAQDPAPTTQVIVMPAAPQAAEPEPPKDEKDPSDRGSFWIEPTFGYSYIDLRRFSQDNFLPEISTTQAQGFAGGLGLGFRVYWLTIGARGVAARYPDFFVGSLLLDVALRIPIGRFEPFVRGGIGYAWLGNPNFDALGDSEVDVHGLVGEVGAGFDIFLSRTVSLGVGVDAAFLNLGRQGDEGCVGGGCQVGNVSLNEDGDAVGLQLRGQARLGLHF
jgi:hypothetical protein